MQKELKSKYGMWTVLGEGYKIYNGKIYKKLMVKCDCGKILTRSRYDIINGKSKSCGCNRSGSKNSNWKGGIRNKSNNIRKSKKYKDWRKKCFERDDYTCQISGQKGGELVVHHLIPFKLLWNDINGEIIYSDNMFNINNGITITKKLHIEFHKKYGLKFFNEENFLEFYEANKNKGKGYKKNKTI